MVDVENGQRTLCPNEANRFVECDPQAQFKQHVRIVLSEINDHEIRRVEIIHNRRLDYFAPSFLRGLGIETGLYGSRRNQVFESFATS